MAGTSYVPGRWLAVVRSRTAVLLGPDTAPALAGAVWNLLAEKPEVHEVLHAVTSSSGGSLASIPSFGILDFAGPLRVFLRGELDLTVELPDGPAEVDGRDVTTWNERRFAKPGLCRLNIAGAGAAGQPELPLGEGVVLLQSLTLGLEAGQAAAVAGPGTAGVVVDSSGNAGVQQPGTQPGPTGPADTGPVPGAGISAAPVEAPPENESQADAPALVEDGARVEAGARDDAGALVEPKVLVETKTPVASGAETLVPGLTVSPEHEVSAETVYAVMDDEGGLPDPAPVDGAPANDLTSSYDHLWERTVMRNIEDAAVREDPEAHHEGPGPEQVPALEPADERPAPAPADGAEAPGAAAVPADGEPGRAPGGGGPLGAPEQRPVTVNSSESPVRPASAGVLIDSVPWRTGASSPASSPQQAPGTTSVGPAIASVAPSAMSPLPESPGTPSPDVPVPMPGTAPGHPVQQAEALGGPDAWEFDADHDGQTVMKGSLAGVASHAAPAAASPDPAGRPLVLARVCTQGHPNPPTRAHCAACGAALQPDAVQVPRPRLGRMRMSTGELLDLDQSLVIGRQPSVSRVQGGVMPRLVQVASPGGDISRSHVEVRLEGWHVMLCDLKATNGTVLVRDGQPPRRLAQNEMAILLDGDIAELGDNISLRFEEIP